MDRYLGNGALKSIVQVIKHAKFGFIGHTLTKLLGKTDKWWQIYKQTSSTFYTPYNVSKMYWEEKLLGHNTVNISLKIC